MQHGDLLGLGAATGFGVGDFCGGQGSRRMGFLWLTWLSLVVSSTGAWALVLARRDPITETALAWGLLAGGGAAMGASALYRGFMRGRMAVAGPISAVGAAALPAVVGLTLGEAVAPVAGVGIVLALPAIWLMSGSGRASSLRAGALDGLVSGVGFAVEFVGLGRASTGAGLVPVAVSQTTAFAVLAVALVVRRTPPRDRGGSGTLFGCAAGILSLAATSMYFLSAADGHLTVASVLTSVYPGVTVVLAAVILREHPARRQLLGMALGAIAVILVVAS